MGEIGERLASDGFAILRGVYSADDRAAIAAHESRKHETPLAPWHKARGARQRFYAPYVAHDRIIAGLRESLGPDIVLWGVDHLKRVPGQVHPWHSDIESCDPEGGFVSVWVALDNVNVNATLNLVAGSHRYGRTVQEIAFDKGVRRADIRPDDVLSWAREIDPAAQRLAPDVSDGDAILFDGRIWHGTRNDNPSATRTALLLQYARADRPVRMFHRDRLEWPLERREDERPPVVRVSGKEKLGLNRTVSLPQAGSVVAPFEIGQRNPGDDFTSRRLFRHTTPNVWLNGHYSVLAPGCSPHPPHVHPEEELLIMLDGTAEIVLPASETDPAPRVERLGPGQMAYYPNTQWHTIRNASERDITYLMFKWRDDRDPDDPLIALRAQEGAAPLATTIFDLREALATPADRPMKTTRVLNAPTAWLRRLHCHVTRLAPGAGYELHRDAHDVALVLLSGAFRTNAKRLDGPGLAMFQAGSLHDMANPTREDALYLVFEWHNLTA